MLLDHRNRPIWAAIIEKFEPEFVTQNGPEPYFFIKDHSIRLYMPSYGCSTESFTHMLLHIYLRAKGIFITEYLLQCFEAEPLLSWSFNTDLFLQVGDYLEDVKIRPLYLKAGFDESSFRENGTRQQFLNLSLQLIRSGFAKPVPASASMHLFITSYFLITSYGKEKEHTAMLRELAVIAPSLFDILNSFSRKWGQADIQEHNGGCYQYKRVLAGFVHAVGQWAINKVHIQPRQRTT